MFICRFLNKRCNEIEILYYRVDVFGTGTDVERFKMVASQTGNL